MKNRRWVWPVIIALEILAISFAILWIFEVVPPFVGWTVVLVLSATAAGLMMWHSSTRHTRK